MKKLLAIAVISLSFSFLTPTLLCAQSDPPHPNSGSNPGGGNNPVGGGAPVGDGIIMLLGLGLSYGGFMFYKSKKRRLVE